MSIAITTLKEKITAYEQSIVSQEQYIEEEYKRIEECKATIKRIMDFKAETRKLIEDITAALDLLNAQPDCSLDEGSE